MPYMDVPLPLSVDVTRLCRVLAFFALFCTATKFLGLMEWTACNRTVSVYLWNAALDSHPCEPYRGQFQSVGCRDADDNAFKRHTQLAASSCYLRT
ncbi:hypothetical protein OE88DRAFT_359972 [Heliocybe sulcata]|uniref:Uncharacterized protein n=1 Tax=Heliocybe sulcata TaxID=5364 RepID=A0A5C3N764_9AGAM|nr:hypothetical protein OE88DRAFT_359972 [Heliocybe sulcata]